MTTLNTAAITALKANGMSDAMIAIMQSHLNGKSNGKVARECRCGCGGFTKGGIYKPGHDAKHLSATLKAMRTVTPAETISEGGEIVTKDTEQAA